MELALQSRLALTHDLPACWDHGCVLTLLVSVSSTIFSVLFLAHRQLDAHDRKNVKDWCAEVLPWPCGAIPPRLTDWEESCFISKQGWIVSGCIGRWTAEVSL